MKHYFRLLNLQSADDVNLNTYIDDGHVPFYILFIDLTPRVQINIYELSLYALR